MSGKMADILVIGATGYTGRAVVKYLASHRERSTFTYAIGGRSLEKLRMVAQKLGLGPQVPIVDLNISNVDALREVLPKFTVVINCVGPFWRTSIPIAEACVLSGVHYTDVTAEHFYVRDLITRYDFLAARNKVRMVPQAGYDSIPSDIVTNLGVKYLKKLYGPTTTAGRSSSSFHYLEPSSISGGSVATLFDAVSGAVPKKLRDAVSSVHCLSPIQPSPNVVSQLTNPMAFVHRMPYTNLVGCFSLMSPVNIPHVYRTWGLYQNQHELTQSDEAKAKAYGPNFIYDEFYQTRNAVSAFLTSLGITLMFICLSIPPIAFLAKKFAPSLGTSTLKDEDFDKGKIEVVNVTVSDAEPTVAVKTTFSFNMDVYYFTAVTVVEVALCLLPQNESYLTTIGEQGGVLTPLAAIDGEMFLKRLEATGKIFLTQERVETEQERKNK